MVQDPPYTTPVRITRSSSKVLCVVDAQGLALAHVHFKPLEDPLRYYGYAGKPGPLDEEAAIKIAQTIARALS